MPVLSLGGKGVISVLSNVAPEKAHDIVDSYLKGDVKTSLKLQLEALNLINQLFCEVNPIPVKAALNMMGFDVGRGRMPLSPLSEKNTRYLRSVLENHGFLERM